MALKTRDVYLSTLRNEGDDKSLEIISPDIRLYLTPKQNSMLSTERLTTDDFFVIRNGIPKE